jgi:hypothetical protein
VSKFDFVYLLFKVVDKVIHRKGVGEGGVEGLRRERWRWQIISSGRNRSLKFRLIESHFCSRYRGGVGREEEVLIFSINQIHLEILNEMTCLYDSLMTQGLEQ